jgi:hypothetical protein
MIGIGILSFFILSRGNFYVYNLSQLKLFLLLIFLLSIYVPFARNNFFAWIATKSMLLYAPFVLSVVYCVDSVRRLEKLILSCLAIMCYVAVFSLTHGGVGSGNYFKDENDLCLYLNMFFPFSFSLFFVEDDKLKKTFYGIVTLIALLAIVKSFSRGGFVGLLSIGFVLWIVNTRKVKHLVALGLVVGMIYLYGGEEYRSEIATISANDGTGLERLESWRAAWRIFIDNPFGVGGNNFQVLFPEYQSEYFKRGMWGRVAHSLWFTLLAEVGIIGSLIYLAMLHQNIRDIWDLKRIAAGMDRDHRYLRALSLGFIGSFVGYFSSGTFLSVLYYPHYYYLTAILVASHRISIKLNSSGDVH